VAERLIWHLLPPKCPPGLNGRSLQEIKELEDGVVTVEEAKEVVQVKIQITDTRTIEEEVPETIKEEVEEDSVEVDTIRTVATDTTNETMLTIKGVVSSNTVKGVMVMHKEVTDTVVIRETTVTITGTRAIIKETEVAAAVTTITVAVEGSPDSSMESTTQGALLMPVGRKTVTVVNEELTEDRTAADGATTNVTEPDCTVMAVIPNLIKLFIHHLN